MDYSNHSSVSSYDGGEGPGSYDIEINHPTIQQYSNTIPTPPRRRGRDKRMLKSANEAAAAKLSQRAMAPTPPRRNGRDKTLIKSANEAAADQILKAMENSTSNPSLTNSSKMSSPNNKNNTKNNGSNNNNSSNNSPMNDIYTNISPSSIPLTAASFNSEDRDRTPSEIDLAKAELEEEAIELEAYYQLRRDAEALGITSPSISSPSTRPYKVEAEEVEKYQSEQHI